jgi:PAS domain S-box-containing protein
MVHLSAHVHQPSERTEQSSKPRRPRSIGYYLVLLAVAIAIPLIGLAFYASWRVATAEREATEAALLNNARSLAAAVDQRIEKYIAVDETLARAHSLLQGDFAEFRQRANEAFADLPDSWLVVLDPTGRVLLNTKVPAGTALPTRPLFDAEQQALQTGQPAVSDVVAGFSSHQLKAFAVVPVLRDGHPIYLLDITLSPDRFAGLLADQHYAAGWLAAIVDHDRHFVARLPDEEGQKLGEPASAGWRNAMQRRPYGVVYHAATDGHEIIDGYAQGAHGWTVGIGIQQSILEGPLHRTQLLLLVASIGCIGLAVFLAWLIARRMHRSATLLHDAAEAMASEQPVSATPTGVREYDEAVSAFAAASRALRARSHERDRAEAALRAREAELAAVINRTPFMLARCSRELRYRFVSQGFADLLGRKPEEIVGRPMAEILGERAFKTILPVVAKVLNGERVEGENEINYRGAGVRFIHAISVPETDERGRIVGWVSSMLDITERKRAEQERIRAEAALARTADENAALYEFTNRLYRAESLSVVYEAGLDAIIRALHCSRAYVMRTDAAGDFRFVAWRGVSAHYRAAIQAHSPFTAGASDPQPVCVEDIDSADLPAPIKAAAQREGIRAFAFIPLMSSEGGLSGQFAACYDAPRTFTPDQIALAGNLARRLGFAAERVQAEQARQEAEQELRKLKEKLETEVEERTLERDRIWQVSEDLLGVSNFEGYFTSINPAWSRLLGWTEAEIKSMHVSELRHPDDAPAAIAGRAQLAEGASTVRMENRFRHKDGSWRWIQWTMTAENGLIYVSGRHVTLEKKAAEALAQAQQRSAHSKKMEALGQLTGGVAHDFNNLLMIVSGHAQSLKRRLTDPKEKRALEAIQIASTRGETLTRQLLSFSRGMPLNPTVISPAETIEAIRDVLSGSLNVNIELSIDVAQAAWPVRVDKSELELALVNLALNARDAMPDGGSLSISAVDASFTGDQAPDGLEGEFVAISVADTGGGIAEDVLSRVFEPFFTTKGPDKGTGLGLSQVYGFARRSGGTALVKSELGRGTTVTIYLPRSHAKIEAPIEEDVGHYAAPTGATVLVVEDNHDVRAVTVSLLEQLGYRTIAVDNAAAALEAMAASRDVSILFSDVVLPGEIDGLLLARTVKARYPDIPIVLTTGYTRVFDSEPEFPVLRKPYQISALGRFIREALDGAKPTKTALAS